MRTLAFLFLSLVAATAEAQVPDRIVTSTVSTTGTVNINIEGRQGVAVLADGTCTGLQWTPQVSANGTVWSNSRAYDVANNTVVTSLIGEGNFVIFPTSGMMQARINITALTATCDFTLRATASGQDPGGSSVAVISFPDNEPVNVAQMNGVAVTMGNGAAGTGVQRVAIASDNTDFLTLTSADTVTVVQPTAASLNATVTDGAGAMNVIVDSITAGDTNIGNVDVVTMPAVESTDSTEQGHPRAPSPDGTALQLTCTTASSTIATLTDGVTYWMGITGASAMAIFGGTATLATGFTVPEGFVGIVRAEGVNAACITAAGTGTLTFTPATYDD